MALEAVTVDLRPSPESGGARRARSSSKGGGLSDARPPTVDAFDGTSPLLLKLDEVADPRQLPAGHGRPSDPKGVPRRGPHTVGCAPGRADDPRPRARPRDLVPLRGIAGAGRAAATTRRGALAGRPPLNHRGKGDAAAIQSLRPAASPSHRRTASWQRAIYSQRQCRRAAPNGARRSGQRVECRRAGKRRVKVLHP